MTSEFLQDAAGQQLLRLASKGFAIQAELSRLSDNIPAVFLPDQLNDRFSQVLFDFSYFKRVDAIELKILKTEELSDLDEECKSTFADVLVRFWQLFDSIVRYAQELADFLKELEQGVYVQHSIESVLLDHDGGQLLSEVLYLYGLALWMLDLKISSYSRERLVVAYYRARGQSMIRNVDDIIKLVRNTGFVPGKPKPHKYPEDYFARFIVPEKVVRMVIGRLRSDDIYKQNQAFPSPDHRSFALANQASLLFIILFLAPDVLNNEAASMREIVDKHFGDNWIVNVYLGHIADLTFWWDSYKAAKTALKNCVDKAVVSALTQRFFEKLVSQTETTKKVLAEGVLTQELLLEQTSKLFNVVRENNITLRWLLLQWFCVDKKLKAIVCKDVNEEMIVTFLLNVSQLEFHMRNILTDLIQKRQSIWEACKKESMERMQELSEYFSGQKPLVRAKQDDSLKQWFLDLKSQIDNLNFSSPTAAARKIVNIVNALENVEEFHKIESSLQVKQFLGDSRSYLQRMIRVVNIKENDLAILNIISDFSFAWNLIQADRFVQVFHDKIKNQPRICLLLRATFLKLVSIMDMPLVRINQCGSRDVVSVAAFYSSELLSFIRKVLEIVPQSMFTSLNSIISIQTSGFKELPLKIQKAEMIEYAQLDSRFELARCTRQISLFTEGILAMETTFVGIIEMEPRDVLEQGIRKELVLQVAKSLNDQIKYKTTKVEEFEDVLRKLGIQFSGFRRSFEYIQDYIQLHGLKVWQEEFGRVLNFNLEQECNLFLKKKILPSESIYQSIAVPIPAFASEPGENCGFIGRLVRELCRHTDPFKNIFVRARQGWFGMDKKETVGIKTFSLLMQALGVQGLSGIDRLISFMIARDLGRCFRLIKTVSTQEVKDLIAELVKEAFPFGKFSVALTKLYQKCWLVFDKISVKKELLEALSNVGQKQLLRIQIANELSFAAKIDSKSLSLCLESLNRSLISDILLSSHKFETQCDLIPELSNFFELSGLTNPVMKLYISENAPCDSFGVFVFLFVMTMVPNLFWLKKADLGHKSRKEKVDGAVFCLGIASLLKQTHPANTLTFISLVGQYVSALTRLSLFKSNSRQDIPSGVSDFVFVIEEIHHLGLLSRQDLEQHIPSALLSF